ncbi:hypothetical protein [Streptomyces lunaelactis]|uniref:hypothetical protein n=1 Tax=Streptomyces lunaelactis TaxID=1535768 RepID=UPI0026960459
MMEPAARQLPAAPRPFAAFARFVLCGGGVGLASSASVALLASLMPWALANALITAASTVLATELHGRFTFGAGCRPGWRQHLQSAGSAAGAYVVTCAAMFVLHLVRASPSMLCEQIVYLSASGLAGIGRFVVLRVVVFAGGRGASQARPAENAKADRARARSASYAYASYAKYGVRPAYVASAQTSRRVPLPLLGGIGDATRPVLLGSGRVRPVMALCG